MKHNTPTPAIRLSITKDVDRALRIAKKRYPALSDPEILKLGLSKIATENAGSSDEHELEELRAAASQSVGYDYLSDPAEDIYTLGMGKKVNFK